MIVIRDASIVLAPLRKLYCSSARNCYLASLCVGTNLRVYIRARACNWINYHNQEPTRVCNRLNCFRTRQMSLAIKAFKVLSASFVAR